MSVCLGVFFAGLPAIADSPADVSTEEVVAIQAVMARYDVPESQREQLLTKILSGETTEADNDKSVPVSVEQNVGKTGSRYAAAKNVFHGEGFIMRRAVLSFACLVVMLAGGLGVALPAHAGSADSAARTDGSSIDYSDVLGPDDIEITAIDESLSAKDSLTVEASEGQVSALAASYSPAGCTGYTDYPHSSNGKIRTSNGPYASVHGRTNCKQVVSRVSAQTSIYRTRWYGEQFLETGNYQVQYVSNKSYDSTPHYYCKGDGTHTYIGYTVSKSTENGTVYSATTRNGSGGANNINRFTC